MIVLLAEDEPLVRSMIVSSLRELGMDVIAKESGDKAWDWINASNHFDLLITDVIMPGRIDGFELAHRCKLHLPDARVIVISGYTGTQHSPYITDHNFLPKPFTLQQLATLIHKVAPNTALVDL